MSRLPRIPLMPLVLCAAVLAAVYFAFSTWHYVTHNYRLARDEDQLRRDIAQLDQEHAQLVGVRDYLKSDEYVEDVARRILGLVRPGETLVIVSGTDVSVKITQGSPARAAYAAVDAPWLPVDAMVTARAPDSTAWLTATAHSRSL